MEEASTRIKRQGEFAKRLVDSPEYTELMESVTVRICQEWMRSLTVEQREQCFAKLQSVGVISGTLRHWIDQLNVQEMSSDQESGNPAL